MVALPIGKLLYIGIKQLAKPIARQIKSGASRSPFFRKYICMPPAQFFHRLEGFVKMRIVGGTGPTHIKPLKEDKAVEAGAEVLSEIFVYSVASSALMYEYWRSSRKEAQIDAEQDRDIDVLQEELNEMKELITKLNERLVNVEQSVSKDVKRTSKSQ